MCRRLNEDQYVENPFVDLCCLRAFSSSRSSIRSRRSSRRKLSVTLSAPRVAPTSWRIAPAYSREAKEALECLLQNDSKLSAPCKSAVSAVAPKVEPKSESESKSEPKPEPKSEPKPEPKSEPKSESVTKESAPKAPEGPVAGASKAAATQTQEDQIKAIRRACTLDDFMAHCSWISPSSPEVVLCLKANAAGLSPACRTAVGSLSNTTATPSPAKPARQERSATVPKKSEPTRASIPSPSPSMTAAQYGQNTDQSAAKCDPSGLPF